MIETKQAERWGVFELALEGPSGGNPFVDVRLSAQFRKGTQLFEVEGFYDGNSVYRIRFMPQEEGIFTYQTSSSCPELNGIAGEFVCTPPSPGNRGPVTAKDSSRFRYADGTRYIPMGTTCYVWHLQNERLQERTLDTLKNSPFNKLRMCVFPKSYEFNDAEPSIYPFVTTQEGVFDLSRFNPEYFSRMEKRIQDLSALGIEADIILFHPYDEGRWGFDRMSAEEDERYVRYVIARLAAFRNVWWSLANEYDLMKEKNTGDWDSLFGIVQEYDHAGHLRSIHNCRTLYDYGKPWVTHASIQSADVRMISKWTRHYGKPVIVDECGYEGNIHTRWGSLTPEEMVLRIWEGIFRGGYVTHGETYLHPDDVLWWSHGGKLHGQSVPRIEFLRKLIEEAPDGIMYTGNRLDASTLEIAGEYYLQYFGPHRFLYRDFSLPEGRYKVDVIDTWNMTVTNAGQSFEGKFRIDLPAKLYYALRIQRVC
ncbi:DUF5605 domain-containing protein [Paenibacillus alkalitolerans]|uniref:DUF5605 domain-containing protein n=1 Tax=Paenibacillus alkalitolerans TaxID=2799335 RepID=UPI0018F7124B|nr:DUF5605 domain-containing protein [Paenibacillus alkalitolerans]